METVTMDTKLSVLQLRVLSGLHEGAVVPLPVDSPALDLAPSGLQADVLLRDAPGQARIEPSEAGWLWREPGFEHPLQAPLAWRWGGIVLALVSPEHTWDDPLTTQLAFDRQPASAQPETPHAPEPQAVVEVAEPVVAPHAEPSVEDQPDPVPNTTAELAAKATLMANSVATSLQGMQMPQWLQTKLGRVIAGLVGAIVLIFLVLVILMVRAAPSADDTPITSAQAPAPIDVQEIKRVIADLKLEESVYAILRQDGRLLLRGVVADDEQLEALSAAVSRKTRRYSMSLLTQLEFEARTRALQPNLPEGVESMAEPGGQLVLIAHRKDVNWILVNQLLDSELPEVVAIDYRDNFTPQELIQLRDKHDAKLAVAAAVPSGKFPALPSIASVIGGDRPFVVLSNGQKWMLGGRIGPVVLQSIDNDVIVFEDNQGNTLRRPR